MTEAERELPTGPHHEIPEFVAEAPDLIPGAPPELNAVLRELKSERHAIVEERRAIVAERKAIIDLVDAVTKIVNRCEMAAQSIQANVDHLTGLVTRLSVAEDRVERLEHEVGLMKLQLDEVRDAR